MGNVVSWPLGSVGAMPTATDEAKRLGERIRSLRLRQGLTGMQVVQGMLAHGEMADVNWLYLVERGATDDPGVRKMDALAKALGVSLSVLLAVDYEPLTRYHSLLSQAQMLAPVEVPRGRDLRPLVRVRGMDKAGGVEIVGWNVFERGLVSGLKVPWCWPVPAGQELPPVSAGEDVLLDVSPDAEMDLDHPVRSLLSVVHEDRQLLVRAVRAGELATVYETADGLQLSPRDCLRVGVVHGHGTPFKFEE